MRLSQALDRRESAEHVMIVLNASGDDTLTWNPTVDEEVARLSIKFDELRAQGHTAYAVTPGESGGKILNRFDKEAEKVVMHPQIRGG